MNEKYWNISIGKTIRDGMAFNSGLWGQKKIDADSIPQTVSDLLVLFKQRNVDYVIVGGIALLTYIQGRNTSNLDLIMAVHSLEKIPEIKLKDREQFFARGEYQGLQLDFLFSDHPLFKLISRKYVAPRNFQEKRLVTATVEGLLLLKLFALPSLYLQGDFTRVGIYENDIATLIQYYSSDEASLIQIL